MSRRTVFISLHHRHRSLIRFCKHMYQNRQEKITKNRCNQFNFRNPVGTIGNKKRNPKEKNKRKQISHKAKHSKGNTRYRLP